MCKGFNCALTLHSTDFDVQHNSILKRFAFEPFSASQNVVMLHTRLRSESTSLLDFKKRKTVLIMKPPSTVVYKILFRIREYFEKAKLEFRVSPPVIFLLSVTIPRRRFICGYCLVCSFQPCGHLLGKS